jgi:CRISPR-associated protein Cas2
MFVDKKSIMRNRQLYIVSYDIRTSRRLSKALRIIRDYASGGQYSCFECYLNEYEQAELIERMQNILVGEDGLFLMPLKPNTDVILLGSAVSPMDTDIYIVG